MVAQELWPENCGTGPEDPTLESIGVIIPSLLPNTEPTPTTPDSCGQLILQTQPCRFW